MFVRCNEFNASLDLAVKAEPLSQNHLRLFGKFGLLSRSQSMKMQTLGLKVRALKERMTF